MELKAVEYGRVCDVAWIESKNGIERKGIESWVCKVGVGGLSLVLRS